MATVQPLLPSLHALSIRWEREAVAGGWAQRACLQLGRSSRECAQETSRRAEHQPPHRPASWHRPRPSPRLPGSPWAQRAACRRRGARLRGARRGSRRSGGASRGPPPQPHPCCRHPRCRRLAARRCPAAGVGVVLRQPHPSGRPGRAHQCEGGREGARLLSAFLPAATVHAASA